MKLRISQIARYFALLSLASTVCSCVAQSTTSSISVEGARPVADAIHKLETIYVLPINYEDIRSVSQSETKVDDQGHLAPKGAAFSFAYEAPATDATVDTRKALAFTAIKNLLESYGSERGVNMFTINRTTEGFDVIPIRSANSWGEIENISSLLNTPVSVSPGQRTAAQLVDIVAQEISKATGRMTEAGTLPMPLFSQHTTSIAAANEPAGSVLARLFREIPVGYTSPPDASGGVRVVPGASLSWRVLCGPEKNPECSINIHTITPKGRSAAGLEIFSSKDARPENQ